VTYLFIPQEVEMSDECVERFRSLTSPENSNMQESALGVTRKFPKSNVR